MPFAIGVEHVKSGVNVGTLLRSAWNFGAAFVFTVGQRYYRQNADTVKAYRQIPLFHFADWDDYRAHAPFAWTPVAVEIMPTAEPLETYQHPKCASYLLGPEDGRISQTALAHARDVIKIPSRLCLNVSTAGAVVMYDRLAKQLREKEPHP